MKAKYLNCIWCGVGKVKNYAKYCSVKCRYIASGKK